MEQILKNNFKKELIVCGVRPDLGAKALICSKAKRCLELGKRVLFYSFELPEEITLRRINVDDDSNLLIKDKVLNNLSDMETTIELFKPDIVFIDYFGLMRKETKPEDIHVLNAYAKNFNIPIIVLSYMGYKFEHKDFTNIDEEEVKKTSPSLTPIIDVADRFIVFSDNGNKQYLLKELKNSFGETSEFDIRDLLN